MNFVLCVWGGVGVFEKIFETSGTLFNGACNT